MVISNARVNECNRMLKYNIADVKLMLVLPSINTIYQKNYTVKM
jgi:hypothetical protein